MKEFDELVGIMERLRAPGGCPWDAKQNHETMAHCAVEEAYELQDAICGGDHEHICEELGDLLLQVVFHSLIARDEGEFTLPQVIDGLARKLVHRHPHVFGDTRVKNDAEVTKNWEALKLQEKGKQARKGLFDGIPASLPALQAARKIQTVARRNGYAWPRAENQLSDAKALLGSLADNLQTGSAEQNQRLIGQILFALLNMARLLDIDPESALRSVNEEFKKDIEAYVSKEASSQ